MYPKTNELRQFLLGLRKLCRTKGKTPQRFHLPDGGTLKFPGDDDADVYVTTKHVSFEIEIPADIEDYIHPASDCDFVRSKDTGRSMPMVPLYVKLAADNSYSEIIIGADTSDISGALASESDLLTRLLRPLSEVGNGGAMAWCEGDWFVRNGAKQLRIAPAVDPMTLEEYSIDDVVKSLADAVAAVGQ